MRSAQFSILAVLLTLAMTIIRSEALLAQDTVRTEAPAASGETTYRYPSVARALSVIPGAGHIYSGEYLHAAKFYFGTVSAIGGGVMTYEWDNCTWHFSGNPCDPGSKLPQQTIGVLMIGAGFAYWVYGAIDAGRAAERSNESHKRSRVILPILRPGTQSQRSADLGVSVAW